MHIAVETQDAKWAYAVSYKLYAPQGLEGAGEPRVVVDVRRRLHDGGLFILREVLGPSGKRRKVYVPVGKAGAAFHVMLVMVSPVGRSVARIRAAKFVA